MDLYLKVRHFLNMYERLDEHYVIYTQFLENHSFMIKLFCVDPALNLRGMFRQGEEHGVLFRYAFTNPIL